MQTTHIYAGILITVCMCKLLWKNTNKTDRFVFNTVQYMHKKYNYTVTPSLSHNH